MGYTRRQQMRIIRTTHVVTARIGWDIAGLKGDVSLLPDEGRITDIAVSDEGTLTIECVEETPVEGG